MGLKIFRFGMMRCRLQASVRIVSAFDLFFFFFFGVFTF